MGKCHTCRRMHHSLTRLPNCRCELHLQHQISCRVFGMGGAIEHAVETGVHDGCGRPTYLRRLATPEPSEARLFK